MLPKVRFGQSKFCNELKCLKIDPPVEGSVSPTRKPKTVNGSPKRKAIKSDSDPKSDSKQLAPIRKNGRNLPKLDRKNGSDEFGNLAPLPPMPTPKKPTGSTSIMNELDTVAESPTESLES